jgi:uncharacterized membrane protein
VACLQGARAYTGRQAIIYSGRVKSTPWPLFVDIRSGFVKIKEVRFNQVSMRQHHIHRLFAVGVTLKALHAVFELALGAAILAVSPVAVSDYFVRLALRLQSGGSAAFLVNFLLDLARAVQRGGQHFAGIYLIVVGLINVVLAIGLLTGALWSYPAALAALALLMSYQMYRYTHTRAVALIALTIFDAIVWFLIWHEYRVVRSGALLERGSPFGHRA